MFIDFVGLLVKCDVHKGKVIFDFHLCVAVHGGAALTVESGCVEVDLHLLIMSTWVFRASLEEASS